MVYFVGSIERVLMSTDGVLSAEISLVMNTATIDVGKSDLTSEDLVTIIDDLGFEVSLLEIVPDTLNTSINGKCDDAAAKNRIRKLMLQLEDGVRPVPEVAAAALASLIAYNGVMTATYSGIQKDSDSTHFKVTIDEDQVGPRALVNMLMKTYNMETTVASLGGFMMAGRMLKIHQREQLKHKFRLLIAAAFTVPLLIITMILPEYPTTDALLDISLMRGLNLYGVLLLVLSSPVQWFVGWSFHVKGMSSMMSGALGMDFLISSGTTAAYMFSVFGLIQGVFTGIARDEDVEYFQTAAVLITVVIFGKYLECYAKGRTAAAIHKLSSLRATHARLVRYEDGGIGLSGDDSTDYESAGEVDVIDVTRGSAAGDIMIDSSLLQRGDVIRLVEGESAPADGIVMTNSVGMDESMLTGESRLVNKKIGDTVFGGTMVVEGSCELTVTSCGDNSALGKIVSLVQAAQVSKPPIQEIADQIARWFVPAVAMISLTTFAVWLVLGITGYVPTWWFTEKNPNGNYILFAFVFSLAVWVSACPCAFGLATPTAILVSTGVAANLGILIRKGAALQHAAEVDVVVFDKTGTLTLGKTTVCDFIVVPEEVVKGRRLSVSRPLRTLLKLLLAAESSSSHPLAKGISEYCIAQLSDQDRDPKRAIGLGQRENKKVQINVVPGQGIKLTVSPAFVAQDEADESNPHDDDSESVQDLQVLVGSQELLSTHGIILTTKQLDTAAGLRVGGKVAVFMAMDDRLRVIIGVSDMVRPDAAAVIATLKGWGMRCYMVTGDQRATGVAIGQAVGIASNMVFAGAKPEEKEKFIEKLQLAGKKVAFIGDGTNDSPALARANVSFAMAGGTDIAIEAGDIVLCRNDLSSMVTAMHLAHQTMRRIKINYFWALVYNFTLIPISAGVFYPSYHFALLPMFAGGAMALSSVCIVLSSLLLMLYRPPVLHGFSREAVSSKSNTDTSLCDCPASLAPILLISEGFLSRYSRKILNSLRRRFSPYYSLLSLISSADADEDAFSFTDPGTVGINGDLESCPAVASDAYLSDVEKFLASTVPVDSYQEEEDEEDSGVFHKGKMGVFSISTSKSASTSLTSPSLRQRSVNTGSTETASEGCNCKKSNCRCGPQCKCGSKR
jgi:P-type Cu+ transporter